MSKEKAKAKLRVMTLLDIQQNDDINEPGLNYKSSILLVLTTPRDLEKGCDANEMSITLPIITRVRECSDGDEFTMDEGEWKEISDRVKNFKWARSAQVIQNFIDAVTEAEKRDFEEVGSF